MMVHRSVLTAVVFAVMSSVGATPKLHAAEALSPAAQRGLTFTQANCSKCHSIGRVGDSPLSVAPPFRTLHLRYPVESLEESLGEGIVTGHPTMPQFRLDPGQVRDVIAYLKSLER